MQVTDVNGIRRTIIQTSENRKAGDSARFLAAALASVNGVCFLSLIARCPDIVSGPAPVI